jgi:hypothetical protein
VRRIPARLLDGPEAWGELHASGSWAGNAFWAVVHDKQ